MNVDKPILGLLKKHKNGFIDLIKQTGLNPGLFNAEETDVNGTPTFVVTYKGSPFRFGLWPCESDLKYFRYMYTLLAPSFPLSHAQPHQSWDGIEKVYRAFSMWIEDHLKPYLDDLLTPDQWVQIEAQKSFESVDSASEYDREPFTDGEKIELRAAIGTFKAHIIEKYDPVEEQLKTINQKLEYLTESVDRLNRFDWKSVALNIVLSIASMLNIGGDGVGALIEFFKGLFLKALLPE